MATRRGSRRGPNTQSAERFAQFTRTQVGRPARDVGDLWRRFSFTVLRLSAQSTPVDSGRARNGWHVSVGVQTSDDIQSGSLADVLASSKAVIDEAVFGTRLWIQNNVPYIIVLEFGLFDPPDPGPSKDPRKGRRGRVLVRGGYSVQAPTGMLVDAVEEARQFYGIR